MIALLTGAAVIGTIALLLSAGRTGGSATPGDPNPRGPWGIATRTPSRKRTLNPHERRWQTALLSGRRNPSRWKDLVADLQELERRADCDLGPAPDRHDAGWVEAAIDRLERCMDAPDQSREPVR